MACCVVCPAPVTAPARGVVDADSASLLACCSFLLCSAAASPSALTPVLGARRSEKNWAGKIPPSGVRGVLNLNPGVAGSAGRARVGSRV